MSGRPPPVCAAVQEVCHIHLDPASTAAANMRVGADRYYTRADNGLTQHWRGNVYLNPPYSRAANSAKWIQKLVHHYRNGDVPEAIAVVKGDLSTRRGAVILASCAAVCFPTQRIAFDLPDRVGTILAGDTNKGVGTILVQGNDTGTHTDPNKVPDTPIKRPNFSTIVVYWGANSDRFRAVFADFGGVLRNFA